MDKSFVIVFGNEKGGTGKSTLAFHVAVSLMQKGFTLCSMDLDGRQGTLSRYLKNRQSNKFLKALTPVSHNAFHAFSEAVDPSFLEAFVKQSKSDIVLIDTPGCDTPLSRQAHALADVLVTPVNDSFIDLDVLVHVENEKGQERLKPSCYAEMVWEQRKKKIKETGKNIHWFVVKNRLSHLITKNKVHVDRVLSELGKRLGFQLLEGFGERVIFRELFLQGRTLLDFEEEKEMTFSHAAARHELRMLVDSIMKQRDIFQKTAA